MKYLVNTCIFWFVVEILLLDSGECHRWGYRTHGYHRRPAENRFKLTTYNLALLSNIPNMEIRREKILEALPKLESDAICIQEAWLFEDINDIVNKTKDNHPYSYSVVHNAAGTPAAATGAPACPGAELNSYITCLQINKCTSTSGVQLLACAVTACKLQIQALPQDCISCLFLFRPSGANSTFVESFTEIITRCSSSPYSTTYGMLLLSKKPLTNTKTVQYYTDIALFPRAYLQAEVEDIGTVICTHLSANITEAVKLEVIDRFDSVAKQSEAEVSKLIQDMAEIKGEGDVFLVGDFNFGPDVPKHNVRREFEESYTALRKDGWYSPYVRWNGACTFCSVETNPLNKMTSIYDAVLIDHIFVRSKTIRTRRLEVTSAKRIYDDNIIDVDGNKIPLSDHYGVTVSFKKRRTGWWRSSRSWRSWRSRRNYPRYGY